MYFFGGEGHQGDEVIFFVGGCDGVSLVAFLPRSVWSCVCICAPFVDYLNCGRTHRIYQSGPSQLETVGQR